MKRVSFGDLFKGLQNVSEFEFHPNAIALSGQEVEICGYLSQLHDEGRYALVNTVGECPDCAPVGSVHLPGFRPSERVESQTLVILCGRLEYGFDIANDGYASFLRLAEACLVASVSKGDAAPIPENESCR